jgi:hypothetical protein
MHLTVLFHCQDGSYGHDGPEYQPPTNSGGNARKENCGSKSLGRSAAKRAPTPMATAKYLTATIPPTSRNSKSPASPDSSISTSYKIIGLIHSERWAIELSLKLIKRYHRDQETEKGATAI